MNEIQEKLKDLTEKAGYLSQKVEELVNENVQLKQKIRSLNSELDNTSGELVKTKEQLDILKVAKQSGDETSGAVLKEKIDRYIKEIDGCLKLLGD